MIGCHEVRRALVGKRALDSLHERRNAAVHQLDVIKVLSRMRAPMRVALRVESQQVQEQQRRPVVELFVVACIARGGRWWLARPRQLVHGLDSKLQDTRHPIARHCIKTVRGAVAASRGTMLARA